jgi:putative transcriptional regulator
MATIGNHLKRCRFDCDDLSQEKLAQAVGVTRQTIISIEKGHYQPSIMLALKIARFFGKQVEEIFYLLEQGKEQRNDR